MPAAPLLATKLYIPRLRDNEVPRPRLRQRLDAVLSRKLGLVCAPPGFGKTTLLTEWLAQCPSQIAWVALDAGDNDPIRFWTYVIAALQRVRAEIGESALAMLVGQQPQRLPLESILTTLINDLASEPADIVIVLDDYHLIEAASIHDGVSFLLDHLPPHVHVICITRLDPPLPIGRWRARDQLIEVRADDLRFRADEVAAFLNQAMGLSLSADDLIALDARTEGWIAGLQLAALALRGRADAHDFIAAFTGSHHYIVDYLTGEVLTLQSIDVQNFLLETSILDRFNAALCAAVTGRNDAAMWLDQVVQANLFITPLDDEGHWYRYHALFADALQHRLQHDRAGRVSQVYRCASDWHVQYGSIEEAIEYALRGGDAERAGDLLILPQAAPELLAQGKLSTLHTWLSRLPAEVIRRRPGLGTTQAWLMAIAGQLNAIEPLLQQIEARLAEMGPTELTPDDREDFVGELAALRAGLALSNFEVPRAIELGEQALAHVPHDKLLVRGMILYTLAAAYRYQPNLEAAARTYLEAQSLSRTLSHPLLALYSLDGLADVRETQGRLHEAAHLREEMLRLTTRHDRPPLPIASTALVGLSKIYRAWNRLDIAGQHAEQALNLAQRNGLEGIVVDSLITSAVVQQAAGDLNAAQDRLRQAAELSQQINNLPLSLRISAYQAQLDLVQHHLDAALRWQQLCGVSVDDEVTELRLMEQMTIARVLIARGQTQHDRTALLSAQKLLARLLRFAESSGEIGQAIEVLTLQAVAYQALGDKTSAMDALERAVQLAEPEDHVRVFLNEGETITALLADLKVPIEKRSSAQHGRLSQFVVRLLEAFADHRTALPVKSSPIQNLVEPLSDRELEVLRLLAAGKKNQEIADALFVVLGTVKAHINSIYRKLEVSTRVQAVTKARELGLL